MEKTIRETSEKVATTLIEMAAITDFHTILEPSAGTGKIIDVLKNNYTFQFLTIECIELNKEKYESLLSKGYFAINKDFLQFNTSQGYDRIIACPPFKSNVDILHIQKMYELLKHKGIMVTLTSPRWIVDNEPIHIQFREWLQEKEYSIKMLPDNSFVEKGKTVPTAILKIFKK